MLLGLCLVTLRRRQMSQTTSILCGAGSHASSSVSGLCSVVDDESLVAASAAVGAESVDDSRFALRLRLALVGTGVLGWLEYGVVSLARATEMKSE